MVKNNNGSRIILGSNSPRRRELLSMLTKDFIIAPAKDVDESFPAGLPAEQIPVFLSKLKSEAYRSELTGNDILITADTVVIHGNDILGKPHDPDDARRILHLLSDSQHKVITGVTICDMQQSISFNTTTIVEFDKLSDGEINRYISEFCPFDKAGAYGIQEWIGAIGIKGINGCYYNVMGLPLHDLYHQIKSSFNFFK